MAALSPNRTPSYTVYTSRLDKGKPVQGDGGLARKIGRASTAPGYIEVTLDALPVDGKLYLVEEK